MKIIYLIFNRLDTGSYLLNKESNEKKITIFKSAAAMYIYFF